MQSGLLPSNATFYRVFHDSPIGMVITTIADGRYADVNQAYAFLLGYTREELIGRPSPIMKVENKDELTLILEVLRRTYKLGDIPLQLTHKDGSLRRCVGSLQLEEIDNVPYFISIIQDVTALEQAREALTIADYRFRLLFQSIPLPLIVLDRATLEIISVNNAAGAVFGYSAEEFVGSSFSILLTPDDRLAVGPGGDALLGGDNEKRLCQMQLKDGAIIEVDVDSYSFSLEGRPATLLIIQDVTEERANQDFLRLSEERRRIIAELASDALWNHDLLTGEIEWSPGLSNLFGYFEQERRPESWWLAHIHPDERLRVQESMTAIFASAESHWSSEYRFLNAEGQYVNVLDRGYLLRDESGQAVRFIGAMVDITEPLHVAEVAAGAALEERRRLAQDLHDAVTQSIYSVSLMAEAAKRRASDEDQATLTDFIGRMGDISQDALRQLRLLLYELRPSGLGEDGLSGALRHRLDAVEGRAGIQGRLIDEVEAPMPEALQKELFLLAQLLLNTILKYASARSVTIRLQTGPETWVIEFEHDGQAIDKLLPKDQEKMTAMQRHVTDLGGGFERTVTRGEVWRYRFPRGPDEKG